MPDSQFLRGGQGGCDKPLFLQAEDGQVGGRVAADEGVSRWQALHELIGQQLDWIERGQAQEVEWVPTGWALAASLPPRDLLLLRADAVDQEETGAAEAQPEEASPEGAQPAEDTAEGL